MVKAKNGYSIYVGEGSPIKFLEMSNVDRQGNPIGDRLEVPVGVGSHLIQNTYSVWARRIIRKPNGEIDEKAGYIEYTKEGYNGELERLDWEDERGSLIQFRYLNGYKTLDYLYQENILQIKIDTSSSPFISLSAGQNDFDVDKQKTLVEFLKAHPNNIDSKSKNPEPSIKNYVYREIKDEDFENSSSVNRVEERNALQESIKEWCSNDDGAVKILLKMLTDEKIDIGVTANSPYMQIYQSLLNYAENNFKKFNEIINLHKASIVYMLTKAEESKFILVKESGEIVGNWDGKTYLFNGEKSYKEVSELFYKNKINEELLKIEKLVKKQLNK